MDPTKRQITKIAREVSKFTVRTLKCEGVGGAEYDFIHVVRKNPGITQAGVREILGLNKGAAARRCANLEAKGYLTRRPDARDGRRQLLYATEQAEALKHSKEWVETLAYEWLAQVLSAQEQAELARLLERVYQRSKEESKAGFIHLSQYLAQKGGEQ